MTNMLHPDLSPLNRPATTADLGRIQIERQRAQAYVDTCVGDSIKARRSYERAMAEEAMAVEMLGRLDEAVRDVVAGLRRGWQAA
jgi:hypothetical protein